MHTRQYPSIDRSRLRAFAQTRLLPAALALAAFVVTPVRADVVFTRSTVTGEAWSFHSVQFTPTVSGGYTFGFNVTAGGPSGDNSVLIDGVKVTNGAATVFADGFETPALSTNTSVSSPSGGTATFGSWAFTNSSGILDGSPPNWGLAGQGLGTADGTTQYGFLQAVSGTLPKMRAINPLQLVAGQTYTVSFYQASRRDFGGTTTYTVTLDFTPPTIHWVNWTGTVLEGGVTKYLGNMVVPRTGGGSTTVNVKFTSPPAGIAFFQTSNGTDYFAQGQLGALGRNAARSPYTSSQVSNIPDGGGAASDKGDIIALQRAGTNTLEFTDAANGSPILVASPVFAYVSLNGNGYGFNQDFDILSFGDGVTRDQGYFGAGTSFKSIVNGQYQLLGTGEPHGVLQFRGSFSSVSWQSLSNEYWNGFTIGVAVLADDIPVANAGPDQTVTAGAGDVASVQLTGSVSGSTKAPFTYTWSGDFGTANGSNPAVTLGIGTHTITLTVTDAAGASDQDSVVVTVQPNPAPVITSPTSASGTYGVAFSYTITASHSPTSFGATNLPAGLTLSGATISGTLAQSGTLSFNVSATNSGGTGSATVLLQVAKATATVVVTPYSLTYDGNSHSATATITGVIGDTGAAVGVVTLNTTHTNAGIYSDSWSFTGSANYNNIPTTAITDTINKADATVKVTGYTGVYDATAHGATGTASGAGGVDLSGSLSLGASFSDVPGGTAHWSFAGGTNYNNQSGDVAIAISKADATVKVTGYTGVYDATAHGATGSASGVSGDLTASLNLGASFSDVPGGTAHWSFAGGTNYNNQSGDVAIAISKADATVNVAGYTGVYDAAAHGATGTASGVGGVDLGGGLSLGVTFTEVPGGTAHWSFAGGTNYNNQSGDVAIAISKADATVKVTGYTGVYDAAAHGATGTASGVGGVDLGGGLSFGGTFTEVPGGSAHWTFSGGTNYNDQSGDAAIVITKANATVNVAGYTGVYDAAAHGATGTATGVGGANLNPSLNLGNSFTNGPGGTVHWMFTGGTNYNDQSGDIAIVITKANATVNVAGYTGVYDAAAHGATGTATGVGGANLPGSLSFVGTFTNVPGGSAHWTFSGGSNYNDQSGDLPIVITKANATVTVAGSTSIYDGVAHGASGSATGVGGASLSGNLDLGAKFTNFPGGTSHWTLSGANNYNDQSGDVLIVINKANATVVVTPYSIEYDAHPHSATVASITGVHGETGAMVGAVALNTTHTSVGTYSADSWSFTGTNNYNNTGAIISDDIHDTTPPVIASVAPSSGTLWPPNHQMVAITLKVLSSDLVGVTGYQVTATSSEPDNGLGDGDTPNDIQITGSGTLAPTINLRAERSGNGNGRTYTITVRAFDAAGNVSAPSTCTVSVPKSQGGGK